MNGAKLDSWIWRFLGLYGSQHSSQNVRVFVRPCWRPASDKEAYQLMEEYPWALLVSNSPEGPLVTNLPLLVDRERGVLLGHLARANQHADLLFAATEPTLAVFHGPYSYVTPSWYPNRDMPGTYYYSAVHCYGRVRSQSEDELESTLELLNNRMEQHAPRGWKMSEVPRSEITRRLPHIVGFELKIERLEAKFKFGQDEPRKDALAVANRLIASGMRDFGEAVKRANIDRAD